MNNLILIHQQTTEKIEYSTFYNMMYNNNVQGTIILCRTIDIFHNNSNDDYDNSNESNYMITKLKKMMVRRLQETKDGGYTNVNSSRIKKGKKNVP